MSFLKKALATVGIGSAKVETILQRDTVSPGDFLSGEVHITGGSVQQDVRDIYLDIIATYESEVDDHKIRQEHSIVHYRLSEPFLIGPEELRVIPFQVGVPIDTPLSLAGFPVYVRTGLDVAKGLDPKDRDTLQVLPHPIQAGLFQALESMGFHMFKADCERSRRFGNRLPFVQEFEFRPRGAWSSRIRELEMVTVFTGTTCEVTLVADRRGGGMSGFLDEVLDSNERFARFQIPMERQTAGIASVQQELDLAVRRLAGGY